MDDRRLYISRDTFRSPLVTLAAVFYMLAFALGTVGVALLFSPEYSHLLRTDLLASGIGDASSLRTWQAINSAITVICCFGPGLLATALFFAMNGKFVKSLGFLGNALHGLYWALNAGGVFAAVMFLFRFVRYVVYAVGKPNAVMLLYSMVISEALMAALAAFLFVLTRKFLNCAMDSCASISYTLAREKLDECPVPAFTATGLLLLAMAGIALAISRLFTLTIVWDSVQSYYKLLTAAHPAQIADVACLISGSGANFLLYRYLRRYKKITEAALFQAKYPNK